MDLVSVVVLAGIVLAFGFFSAALLHADKATRDAEAARARIAPPKRRPDATPSHHAA